MPAAKGGKGGRLREARVFTTEAEFRQWFEKNLSEFGVHKIVLSQEACPDYVVIMEDNRVLKLEAELFASNFKYHGHDPKKADYILAGYAKTPTVEGVPVMALHRLWCFDIEPTESIPPEAVLSEEEAQLLSAIHSSGGISVAALSQGNLAGEGELWTRVHPARIATIPRGRIVDSVVSVLSQSTKEWLRKYHHLLIGAGISQKGCELLESLFRRNLIGYRPIEWLAAAYDGSIIDHPAWLPTEVYATDDAWTHHEADIMQHLLI